MRALKGLLLLTIAVLVVSCTRPSTPRNIDNICSIFAQKPYWYKEAIKSEAKWGAPATVQMAIMWRESSFRANAAPPKKYILGFIPNGRKSSAYGYSQALDGTWDWYRKSTGNRGADRSKFSDAIDFIGWYMTQTKRSNRLKFTDAYHQYLAYHEGHNGFKSRKWQNKAWLKRAAGQVDAMAKRYSQQIRGCS